MPDPTKTLKDWPPSIAEAPTQPEMSAVVAVVLAAARERLGQRETGRNQGPIVQEVCAPFLSAERFEAAYAAGELEWCAAFACFCWRQGWPKMPRALISLEVQVLWARLALKGWTRRWAPVDPMAAAPPKPGDIFFKCLRPAVAAARRKDAGKPVHCGLVLEAGAKTVVTIEGNAFDGESSGEVKQVHYALSDERIFGFATIQPGDV